MTVFDKKYMGVNDLLKKKKIKPKVLKDILIKYNIVGNWECKVNLHNLCSGKSQPRDPRVYIILSQLLDINIALIIDRYSPIYHIPLKKDSSKLLVNAYDFEINRKDLSTDELRARLKYIISHHLQMERLTKDDLDKYSQLIRFLNNK